MRFADGAWIYGSGSFSRRVADCLADCGVEVRGFVDHRVQAGATGVTRLSDWNHAGEPVILAVLNPYGNLMRIQRFLEEKGACDVVSPVQVSRYLAVAGVDLCSYWLTGDYERRINPEGVERARRLLFDDESRYEFDRVIRYRTHGEVADSGSLSTMEDQYNPEGVPYFGTNSVRFVDGGAFTGDTVRSLARWGLDIAAVLAFEPEFHNFTQLTTYAATLTSLDLVTLPLALGRGTVEAIGLSSNGGASRIETSGFSAPVVSTSLDSVAPRWDPTHVKLDIEGAELDALMGMKRTLHLSRPNLAISSYHTPEHHWEILNWVAEQALDYQFFIRVHGQQTFDTVLYCVRAEAVSERREPE